MVRDFCAGPALPKLLPDRRADRCAHRLRRDLVWPSGERLASPLRRRLMLLPLLLAAGLPGPLRAASVELARLELQRSAEGVVLNFDTHFELPAGVEGALQRGVALHFVAEVRLLRSRWYWFDRQVVEARRSWRLSYQPLTFSYRVSLGGLSQTYASLPEALRAVQRTSRWRIAEAGVVEDDIAHTVVFQYRLDADQLPRPLQISIAGRSEWQLAVERTITLPADR